MSVLAAASVAALLIASPSQSNAQRLAANGGFLLGNAQRCGIAPARIEREGRLIRGLISAAAAASGTEDAATSRFAAFFLVSALAAERGDAPLASCDVVTREFARLERHSARFAAAGE